MVAEADTAVCKGKMSNEECEWGEWDVGIGNMSEEAIVCSLEDGGSHVLPISPVLKALRHCLPPRRWLPVARADTFFRNAERRTFCKLPCTNDRSVI